MGLHLAGDVAGDPARILDVFLAMRDLPHRLRLRPDRVPHVHGEDQGVAARVVVEDHLGRRIGENAAVPIELAVDAHGREGRRQCARCQDVLDADLDFAAVEVAHLAGAHMRGADREPRLAPVDEREIDQLAAASSRAGRSSSIRPARRPARRDFPRTPLDWARRSPGCRGSPCSSRTMSAKAAARPMSRARTPCTPCDPRIPSARAGGCRARCRRSGWR